MEHSHLSDTCLPTKFVGPLAIRGETTPYEVKVPLATYESPLWPSVARGARAANKAGGISVTITQDHMARSILFEAPTASRSAQIISFIERERKTLFAVAEATSRFLRCVDLSIRAVGPLVYLRLCGTTGDAAGHNMITKGADAVLRWLCQQFADIRYVSVSGNYCTDKKVSSINAILGRGKSLIAEVFIPDTIVRSVLKTSPLAITELNDKKNLVGSIISGSVQSANAHFANMLLAVYLATGQDAANIVEGSQGITFAEVRGDGIYFSVSLPNVIVGTVGIGKESQEISARLEALGCKAERPPGQNSRRLAEIVAATVLCGELSLLAAQTNPGELVRTHMAIERKAT